MQAYQSLYESSIAYGMRKALMAEQKKNEMQTNITTLRQACEDLENEVARLDQEIIDIAKKDADDSARDEKAHQDFRLWLTAAPSLRGWLDGNARQPGGQDVLVAPLSAVHVQIVKNQAVRAAVVVRPPTRASHSR